VHERRPTSTSNFGVGRRESHDATVFYDRFRPPELSDDEHVLAPQPVVEPFVRGDARSMDAVADGSVALVVTSPPYFAGKQYEEELDQQGVPSSYLEYLDLLTEVFAECARKLEPGGRIAVNVANLGRKPYRSLSADVIRILEHDLGLLLRGELIWQKAAGASGSCAWGSFRSAANPVLRDITERVVVASKGRFDRARSPRQRLAGGLPHQSTLMADEFMARTLDLWSIPPESARRVGHPAPFPVELPDQLIRLYTFADDLVLDPFMGSGSSLVAAAQLARRYVGYDLDPAYVALARRRVDEVLAGNDVASLPLEVDDERDCASQAKHEGKAAKKLAEDVLVEAGFAIAERDHRVPHSGVTVSFLVTDATEGRWYVMVAGPFTSHQGGLLCTDTVWETLGMVTAVKGSLGPVPILVLTSHLPRPSSRGDMALRAAGPGAFFDVIGMLSSDDRTRLARYARGGRLDGSQPGFWTRVDLARRAPPPEIIRQP
jgi:site-specific DNA-methyltransferase (adenine-specific)